MTENPQEALNKVLEILRGKNARGVADDISKVIARGITEEIEIKGKVKELSQRPLEAGEAYKVAVAILVAFVEPIIMKKHALREITKSMDVESSLVWRQDYVEKTLIAPETYEEVSFSDLKIDGVEKLEEDLKNLVKMIGEI